jgi:hypothetical protein
MSFIEVCFDRKNGGFTATVCEDAFLITLQMRTCHFDLYADGKLIRPQSFDAGVIGIFDLRQKTSSELKPLSLKFAGQSASVTSRWLYFRCDVRSCVLILLIVART